MKPPRTCILLLNGNHARLVYHTGPGKKLELSKENEMTGPNLHGRDIYADRPGRTFDRIGAGRHAKEYTNDPVQVARKGFFADVVKRVEDELAREPFSRLIIAAPSRILAEFSTLLPAGVSELIYAELRKDLTQIPVADLPKHFESVIVL